MATKNEPGEFDCYGNADGDEPIFTLRAKDPLAPALVRMWIEMRSITTPAAATLDTAKATRESRKRAEAAECARKMEAWRTRQIAQGKRNHG